MRTWRLVATAGVVSFVLGGGLYALAPVMKAGSAVAPQVAFFDGAGSQIGLSVRDVEAADVARQKLAGESGAVVDEVRSETPGAKAGIKAGDVVVGFDGERVRSARQLERLVDETPSGRTVKMAIMRDGSKVDLDITPQQAAWGPFVTPGVRPHARTFERVQPDPKQLDELRDRVREFTERPFPRAGAPATRFHWDGDGFGALMGHGRLGVQVEGIEDQLATYFGVKGGALVRSVTDGSPAAKAGVKAGDVITAINGKAVKDVDDLRQALSDLDDGNDDKAAKTGQEVALSLTRDRKALSLKATLEPPQAFRYRGRRSI